MEDTLMITPDRAGSIAWSTAWVVQTTPRRLVSSRARAFSSGISTSGPAQPRPALLTRMSTRSKSRRAAATNPRAWLRTLTSTRFVVTLGEPASRERWATAWRRSSRRPQRASRAPFLAKASAVASPIPLEAPVIRTTLFLRRKGIARRLEAGPWGPASNGVGVVGWPLAGDLAPGFGLHRPIGGGLAEQGAGQVELGLERPPHLLGRRVSLQRHAGPIALA